MGTTNAVSLLFGLASLLAITNARIYPILGALRWEGALAFNLLEMRTGPLLAPQHDAYAMTEVRFHIYRYSRLMFDSETGE